MTQGISFRYRFVGFGTQFKAVSGVRPDGPPPEPGYESELFANELATDVGGRCWGPGSDLAVIDHHFVRTDKIDQFPSASAAVLHNARRIRERFLDGGQPRFETVWLVTHEFPDFDAFCSMYLARKVIEGDIPADESAWRQLGVNADGWAPVKIGGRDRRVNWFHLHADLPATHAWAMQLAAYAAAVDNCRRIECRRDRALHSVLYAALRRGRPYETVDNGAVDFFYVVRDAMRNRGLNPRFDSIFEDSPEFAPELRLLDGQEAAYARDLKRARTSIVFLRQATRKFSDWFREVENPESKTTPSFRDAQGNVNPTHLSPPDGRTPARVQEDAVYLRDPECLLFKEWARTDTANSSLGRGFLFTAVAYSGGRVGNPVNGTDYYFSIDPERAGMAHLYPLWTRLQAAEMRAVEAWHAQAGVPLLSGTPRREFLARGREEPAYFVDPWFDGQNYNCTIVPTPRRGTYIAPTATQPALRSDLLDDPVVAIVREELEYGAQFVSPETADARVSFEVADYGVNEHADDKQEPKRVSINQPRHFQEGRPFRVVTVRLAPSVDLTRGQAARLIGATLWEHLEPAEAFEERPGRPLPMTVSAHWVVVWTANGVAFAVKEAPSAGADPQELRNDFLTIIRLSARVNRLVQHTAAVRACQEAEARSHRSRRGGGKSSAEEALRRAEEDREFWLGERVKAGDCEEYGADEEEALVRAGQVLLAEVAEIRHKLTTPQGAPLRGFFEASGIERVVTGWVETHQASVVGENVQNIAEIQSKLKWAEIFIITVYALELVRHIEDATKSSHGFDWWGLMLAAFLVPLAAIAALRPPVRAIGWRWLIGAFVGYAVFFAFYSWGHQIEHWWEEHVTPTIQRVFGGGGTPNSDPPREKAKG